VTKVKVFVFASCHVSATLENDDPTGTGGYGVVINIDGNRVDEFSGGYSNTTNARINIIAITQTLLRIKPSNAVSVYLPNGYVVDTLSKGWLESWKKKGYQKKKHVDLWKALDSVIQASSYEISFLHSKYIKNHPDYLLAAQLARTMTGKKNLPVDQTLGSNPNNLFDSAAAAGTVAIPVEDDKPILESVCVDASTSGNPGPTEYRGVDTKTGKVIFQQKIAEATNNIGEFLAIVHALALYKRDAKELKVVYSDSANAISWITKKKCKTKFEKTDKNAETFDMIERAIKWLNNNSYETKVLKWNTGAWGEVPADYGRK
jgi:ribonuclease HI